MKRQTWFILSAIVILLIIFGAVTINNKSITGEVIAKDNLVNGEKSDGELIIEEPIFEEPKIEGIAPVTVQAKIINFAFVDNEIEINVGDTVVWENRDSARHTVTSDDGVEMQSVLLAKGERYSHTFTKAGEFSYYCIPHPYMKGKIIVK